MEFWGAVVKAGKPITVKPDEDCLIHVSQASLDFRGKKGEAAVLYVKVDGKKHVIGTLSSESIPQSSFDLVFDKEFELSHSLEKGSVLFIGYKSPSLGDQFAFIDLRNNKDIDKALKLNGSYMGGRELEVTMAKRRSEYYGFTEFRGCKRCHVNLCAYRKAMRERSFGRYSLVRPFQWA